MKGLYFLILLAAALLLISSCTINQVENKVVCGDEICDASESCACDDCKGEEKCKVTVVATCDDGNECTEDIFNELTKQCEHKKIDVCCGNGKCEEGERCNLETAETSCPDDCELSCPAKVTMSKFTCDSGGCRETGENEFEITSNATIKVTLTNVGERATGKVNSIFVCPGENPSLVSGDYKEIKGVRFSDYFNDGIQSETISSRISKTGSSVDYKIKFEFKDVKAPFNLVCSSAIRDEVNVNLNPELKLAF